MSWSDIVLESTARGTPLRQAVAALLASQRVTWPAYRDGEAALAGVRTRTLWHQGARLLVQANPGRRASVHARVDAASVAARPCFLCADNMPAEERGIAHGDLVLLPNPFPIVPEHLTIPSRQHQPQRLAGRIGDLLTLTRALAPDMLVLYNGPRCGASAPDHFHFQAGSAGGVPLLEEHGAGGPEVAALSSFGRRALILRSPDAARMGELVDRTLTLLGDGSALEPPTNIVGVYRDRTYLLFLFPRARHRPQCFDAAEPQRIAVSPAALEMMGVLVVADPEHLDRVDATAAHALFEEVCVNEAELGRIIARLSCS